MLSGVPQLQHSTTAMQSLAYLRLLPWPAALPEALGCACDDVFSSRHLFLLRRVAIVVTTTGSLCAVCTGLDVLSAVRC